MRISIQAKGFNLTEGLREHTERRLRFALNWANPDVCTVSVSLADVNGPNRRNDKRCIIRTRLVGAQDIVIEDAESDLHVAIDRAVDRTQRTVARRLQRLREQRQDRRSSEEVSTEASVPPYGRLATKSQATF